MSDIRRSIPTRYNNLLFRSKLEADWARAFDALGVAWQYEKEGRYFGNVFYLPDFYLPRSRQYVEVKGQWTPECIRKANALIANIGPSPHVGEFGDIDVCLVAAHPGGAFYGYTRYLAYEDLADFILDHSRRPLKLAQCEACRGWWFFDEEAGWQCHCCGAREGFRQLYDSPLEGWPNVQVPAVWGAA